MNPYRMPRPRDGVTFTGHFCVADDKGRIDDSVDGVRLRLTQDYLWISRNLTVPLAAILRVDNLNGKAIGIHFRHEVQDQVQSVWLAARDWLGLRHTGRNLALLQHVEAASRTASPIEELLKRVRDESGDLHLGCEVCGAKPAADAEFGWFFCFGVLPFAGVYRWTPVEHLRCSRHAARACLVNNLLTGLLGYWGFPGVLVAPYRVWRNVRELNTVYGWSATVTLASMAIGFLLPITLLIALILRVVVR